MRKDYLCFLTVAMVIASIMIAGCTTSNQANQASSSEKSTNASTTTTTTTTTSSSVASASPTVTPSPSASPTAATPTPASGKIATSIQFANNPSVSKGQTIGINVISSMSGIRICAPGSVTATIATVTSGGSDCYYTAYINTSGLNPGTYDVTLKFAGDSTYQPSQSTEKITITA
jgi:hypothetical protein